MQGSGFRVQGSGFRVQGSGSGTRVSGSGRCAVEESLDQLLCCRAEPHLCVGRHIFTDFVKPAEFHGHLKNATLGESEKNDSKSRTLVSRYSTGVSRS